MARDTDHMVAFSVRNGGRKEVRLLTAQRDRRDLPRYGVRAAHPVPVHGRDVHICRRAQEHAYFLISAAPMLRIGARGSRNRPTDLEARSRHRSRVQSPHPACTQVERTPNFAPPSSCARQHRVPISTPEANTSPTNSLTHSPAVFPSRPSGFPCRPHMPRLRRL